jgi:hypothetical protein
LTPSGGNNPPPNRPCRDNDRSHMPLSAPPARGCRVGWQLHGLKSVGALLPWGVLVVWNDDLSRCRVPLLKPGLTETASGTSRVECSRKRASERLRAGDLCRDVSRNATSFPREACVTNCMLCGHRYSETVVRKNVGDAFCLRPRSANGDSSFSLGKAWHAAV